MKHQRSSTLATRQRIITTANRLFYAEGVKAVGIDRIIAEAGVAKMSLYNHFSSKDDLIVAVLEHREQVFHAQFNDWIAAHRANGLGPLGAFFAALKDWFTSPVFRGCMFINAHAELADVGHVGNQFAVEHKRRFRASLTTQIAEVAGPAGADRWAPAIALLVEGAIVTAAMNRSADPAEVAYAATLALLGLKKSP